MNDEIQTEEIEEKVQEDGYVFFTEFTCHNELETYISKGRPIPDGTSWIDVKSDGCPYCNCDGHWRNINP